ncbi:MAG: 2-phospho-L-lactate transferase [Anaerolineae bacterium]|jgi:LPPG:FO 2-phospho-L-lactate transferase|nr:2-phospho-L-lactate transferase [Anaerolineae bacterium]
MIDYFEKQYGGKMRVTALAGGVGGAKLADGLYRSPMINDLAVIVNIGDDFEHFGLTICPDLDTVCYTLAGIANPDTGWGQSEDTYAVIKTLERLGGPSWFKLGDKDIATHMERTRLLRARNRLSTVTAMLSRKWGIECCVLPASDDPVPTIVSTVEMGSLAFQEYFVKYQYQPQVVEFIFKNASKAQPAPGVLEAIEASDLIIFCPSNPWVSLDPILAIPGIREAVSSKRVIAISPIIGGKTVKGPAAKMFKELGIYPSALAVADHYRSLLEGILIDHADDALAGAIDRMGIKPLVTDTFMRHIPDRIRLAEEAIHFAKRNEQ